MGVINPLILKVISLFIVDQSGNVGSWTEELLNNTLKDGKVVNAGVVGGKL